MKIGISGVSLQPNPPKFVVGNVYKCTYGHFAGHFYIGTASNDLINLANGAAWADNGKAFGNCGTYFIDVTHQVQLTSI